MTFLTRLSLITFCSILFVARTSAQDSFESIVANYQDIATSIIESARKENDSYMKLQELCDDIGNRLSGSESLDKAIEWAVEKMKADGHANVRAEKVMVNKWVRGNEYCEMVTPRSMSLGMLGLGGSIATPNGGITAEVVVVSNKEELDALADEKIKGKIVVFNYAMPAYSETNGSGYGESSSYRGNGASWAAERGAIAALVRSATAYSLNTPHTGAMRYKAEFARIPTASLTIEAASMLARLQAREKTPTVKLYMEARDEGEVPSANVLAEIVGSEKPEEIVVIGGHIDSWDVGQGAHDDGAGCVAAMEALNILRKLKLQPKRTIRVVLWTNEENGTAGARHYLATHQDEKHVAGIESDSGGFSPEGLSIDIEDKRKEEFAQKQLDQLLKLLEPINANRSSIGFSGVDVGQLKKIGTPCLGLKVDGRRYFNTHHTFADTVDKVNPSELTDCAITLAIAAYVLADIPGQLGETSESQTSEK